MTATDQEKTEAWEELEKVLDQAEEKAKAKAQDQPQPEYDGPDRETYAADGRLRLDVVNPAIVAEKLRRTLGKDELAGVFRRSGELVHTPRIGEDGPGR